MDKHELHIDGETFDCSVERSKDSTTVTIGERQVMLLPTGNGGWLVRIGGDMHRAAAATVNGKVWVDIDGHVFELQEPSQDGFAGGADAHSGEKDKAFAPMPGKVVKVMVAVGDEVKERQQLVIVEAMKMENPVVAKAAGKVKAVNCADGEQVDTETVLVELELAE